MKKKVITMMMALTMALSTAGFSYASTTVGSTCTKNVSVWPDKIPKNFGTANDSTSGSVVSGSMTSQVVTLVNKERASNGLQSLASDRQLAKLAQMKAEDMAKNGYFSHISPTYGSAFDMMKKYGVSYKTAGENIAKGQKTAQSVMNGWMNSSGHRANILKSDYTKIGVGCAKASDGTTYWVQIFKG